MRAIFIAMLVALGIGLFGAPSSSTAAPFNGGAILNQVDALSPFEQVQHWRWGSRWGHWRWGSRGGHWRWGSGGHWRWGSRGRWWRRY